MFHHLLILSLLKQTLIQHLTNKNTIICYCNSYYFPQNTWGSEHSVNLQLINFPLIDHGVLGEIRSHLPAAAGAEAAGSRAPWSGHNTRRHRCSGGGGRAHRSGLFLSIAAVMVWLWGQAVTPHCQDIC